MNKSDIKEAHLDRPYKVQIVLSQYTYEDSLDLGWECDIFYEGELIAGGTAPTIEGVYDLANEIIWDYENEYLWRD